MPRPVRRGPASKRRACVAVLVGLAAFALLQLTLNLGVETGLVAVRDPLYACRLGKIRRRLGTSSAKPCVLVMLGSSRTQFGFRAHESEAAWGEALGRPVEAYNFGVSGGGPATELLTWRRLRRDGVRPELLLIEVTPPFVAGPAAPADLGADRLPVERVAWPDLSMIQRYSPQRRGLRRDWLRAWPLPCYTHRIQLISFISPGLLPPGYGVRLNGLDESGGFPSHPVAPEERVRAARLTRTQYQAALSVFRLGGPACDALRELLDSCRDDRVRAALVVMPEGPTFRSWYPPEAWPQFREWLDRLGQERGAPVIDAREWCDEEDFMDSHHLMPQAADRFTDRLGREYVLPLLRAAATSSP